MLRTILDITLTRQILDKVRQVEIRSNRLVDEALSGHYHSTFKGRGINFEEVREYVPGDEVRTIDWKVTAKAGKPFIKKFTEERELTVMLLIDLSASGNFGSQVQSKRELAAEFASVLAFSAGRNNDKVGLILFSDQVELFIPPKKGRSHFLRVIREILFFKPKSKGTDLIKALDFLNRVVIRKSVAFLISDFWIPSSVEELERKCKLTNKHHDLVSVFIQDPREYSLPNIGLIVLEDAETGEQVEIDTSRQYLRNEFAKQANDKRAWIFKCMHHSGVDLMEIQTAKPYLAELLRFFAKREKRRS